jgi:hypothetical protein
MYPEAKSVSLWLRHGWHIAVAYVIGFFVMLAVLGWRPDPDHKKRVDAPSAPATVLVVESRPGVGARPVQVMLASSASITAAPTTVSQN